MFNNSNSEGKLVLKMTNGHWPLFRIITLVIGQVLNIGKLVKLIKYEFNSHYLGLRTMGAGQTAVLTAYHFRNGSTMS